MDEQSIVRVLESLGATKIKRAGSRVQSACPFAPYRHTKGTDKHPSFGMEVNPSGPSKFHCFSCKASGQKAISLLYVWKECTGTWRSDLQELIRDQEGGSLRERASRLGSYDDQRRSGLKGRGETSWHVPGYERAFTYGDYDEIYKSLPQYALDRGITVRQAKKWHLGFDQKYQRLFISIIDEKGKLVGYSKRAIHDDQEPKYLHAKDMARDKYLYGEEFIDRRCRLGFVMEGFMDVLAMERNGWRNMVGTMGTKPSREQIAKLKKWFDCVVIFPHNDDKPPLKEDGTQPLSPGQQMAKDYKDALEAEGMTRVYVAPVFQGRKDPGEWSSEEHAAMRKRLGALLDEFEPAATEGSEASQASEAQGQEHHHSA